MRKAWLAFVTAGLLAVWSAPASAVVIYDNGAYDKGNSFESDSNSNQQCADDFSLGSLQTIWDVHWWGDYAFSNTPPAGSDFTVNIFADNGGAPGSLISTFSPSNVIRTDTGDSVPGPYEIFRYDAVAPGVTLSAGTYYISIVNNTPDTDDDWFWATSNSSSGTMWYNQGAGWNPYEAELAFNLTNDPPASAVPEPATMTLLGLGLAGLIGRRMRRSSGR